MLDISQLSGAYAALLSRVTDMEQALDKHLAHHVQPSEFEDHDHELTGADWYGGSIDTAVVKMSDRLDKLEENSPPAG